MSHNNLDDFFGIGSLGVACNPCLFFDFSYNRIDFIPTEISNKVNYYGFLSLKNRQLTYLSQSFANLPNNPRIIVDISKNFFSEAEHDSIEAMKKNRFPTVTLII